MKIAVASDTPDLTGRVPALFAETPYLLIVEADEGTLLHVAARDANGDVGLARLVLHWDCEGILCGPIEEEPFLIIADEGCVTRFLAAGLPTTEALTLMEARRLEYIRDFIGGPGCGGGHSGAKGCDGDRHH